MNGSGSTTGGTTVYISGSGFSQATQVLFGSTLATSFTVNSDSLITAVAPSHVQGNVDVIVVSPTGASNITLSDQYSYQAPIGVPTVTNVTPGTEAICGGDSITITGSGFTNATSVSFGGTLAYGFSVMSDTTIVAVAPNHTPPSEPGACLGDITSTPLSDDDDRAPQHDVHDDAERTDDGRSLDNHHHDSRWPHDGGSQYHDDDHPRRSHHRTPQYDLHNIIRWPDHNRSRRLPSISPGTSSSRRPAGSRRVPGHPQYPGC